MEGKSIDRYTGSIRIAKVNTTDEGNYTCRVLWKENRPHETEDTVAIEVLVVGKCFRHDELFGYNSEHIA